MSKFIICLLVLGTLTQQATSLTILERHLEKQGNPKLRLAELKTPNVHDWVFQHDLEQKLNYKSIFHVGTFRGLPIKARQNSVYVDGSGEIHSILPYTKAKDRNGKSDLPQEAQEVLHLIRNRRRKSSTQVEKPG